MIQFLLLISRHGKVRLAKWYAPISPKDKARIVREVSQLAVSRPLKASNFVDNAVRGGGGSAAHLKIVTKRYASLYFVAAVTEDENELLLLEKIHHFVEVLDKYFRNVCELDLIYNFHRAYVLLDEVLLGGELLESSKKAIMKAVQHQESLLEDTGSPSVFSE
jgi:AP-1 complex subunit sigma 1/2